MDVQEEYEELELMTDESLEETGDDGQLYEHFRIEVDK